MSEQAREVPGSWLHYAGFKAIGWLTARLPLRAQYALTAWGADLYFYLHKSARENVCANLSVVIGSDTAPAEVRAMARKVFQSFGRYLCEFLNPSATSGDFMDRRVKVEGREHIEAALKAGRGVLLCSGHYSNWELGPAIVAWQGFPVLAIVQMHGHPKINEIFVRQRAERGVTVVHSEDGALRALRALKINQAVAMIGDRQTGGPTIAVQLFGRKTELPQGPWRLALSSGAALLPTFVVRRPDNSYCMEIGAPLTAAGYKDPRELAQAWADVYEARVRADPTQWEIFYDIWDCRTSKV